LKPWRLLGLLFILDSLVIILSKFYLLNKMLEVYRQKEKLYLLKSFSEKISYLKDFFTSTQPMVKPFFLGSLESLILSAISLYFGYRILRGEGKSKVSAFLGILLTLYVISVYMLDRMR